MAERQERQPNRNFKPFRTKEQKKMARAFAVKVTTGRKRGTWVTAAPYSVRDEHGNIIVQQRNLPRDMR